jgi:leader peptidase (prepilin peptidase)/N-methyltransferase
MPLGMSVARPASHCPHCNHYLRPWDNIPLIAFLLLGGRCRFCRAPISWRYFGVELLTASLWVALYWRLSGDTGISWLNYVAVALFASVLIAVIFIDLDHFFIPDELNWVGVALGVGRDLACLALAWLTAPYYLPDVQKEFTYGGWLPGAS